MIVFRKIVTLFLAILSSPNQHTSVPSAAPFKSPGNHSWGFGFRATIRTTFSLINKRHQPWCELYLMDLCSPAIEAFLFFKKKTPPRTIFTSQFVNPFFGYGQITSGHTWKLLWLNFKAKDIWLSPVVFMPVRAERSETLISSITAVQFTPFIPCPFSPPLCSTSLKIQTVHTSFT